ncbi:hypothetical protein ACR71G_07335 [Xenorhabdus bovienii]|uniref:hypothetical protein n=1 Tax=Xenorhabdus bovienii TaxID=40576 RepID=UPI003DA3EB73
MHKSPTMRSKINLPPMPSDDKRYQEIPVFNMVKGWLNNDGELQLDRDSGMEDIVKHGFFLLKFPPKADLTFGDMFVNNFYKEKQIDEMNNYTGFKECILNNDYEGYFDRPHDQWENFYIEKNNWHLIPRKVSELANLMSYSGICVLKSVFHYIGVESNYWPKITGGLTENHGHQMMAFNHFRPEKKSVAVNSIVILVG